MASFDECRTIKIKNLPNWANEHRSKGFVGIYGYQSIEQLEDAYGKNGASILRSALGNRFWFNPGNLPTAKTFSETIGQKEVIVKSKSRARNFGSSGGQKTVSENIQLAPLLRSDDFTSFPQGACVYTNEHLKKGDRGNIPWYIKKIRVSKKDKKLEDECKSLWSSKVISAIRTRELCSPEKIDLEEQLVLRHRLAEKLFPLPPGEEKSHSKPNSIDTTKHNESQNETYNFMF